MKRQINGGREIIGDGVKDGHLMRICTSQVPVSFGASGVRVKTMHATATRDLSGLHSAGFFRRIGDRKHSLNLPTYVKPELLALTSTWASFGLRKGKRMSLDGLWRET